MHEAEPKLTTGDASTLVDHITDIVEDQLHDHIYELERELGIE